MFSNELLQTPAPVMDSPSQSLGELALRSLVRSLPGALAAADAQGRQLFVNPAFVKLVGWTDDELVDQPPPYRYWRPEDAPSIQAKLLANFTKTVPDVDTFVSHFIHKNSERIPVRQQWTPLFDESRRHIGWMTAVEDLRQAAKVNELLREQEHFIESVTRAVPEIIYVHDLREHRNVYVNRNIGEMLGFAPEQLKAMGSEFLERLMHPDDFARLPELFARWETAQDGQVLEAEYRLRSAGGNYRWFLGRDTVFRRDETGRALQLIGATQDVTARKEADAARGEAEKHLRESERRYRLLADHATDMISRHTPAGLFLDVSPASSRLLGNTPHELIGRSMYEIVHPADRDEVFRYHVELMSSKTARTALCRVRRKDGTYVWVETHAQPILGPQTGEVAEILAVSRDVTDRRQAQDALRQSEELFRVLVEKSSDGIAMVDADGRIRYLSPAAARILGLEPGELAGIKTDQLVDQDDLKEFREKGAAALAQPGGSYSSQLRVPTRDGAVRHLEVVVTNHVADPAVAGFIVNFRDISDRIALEEQLRQAQKMEAVGQLAGGIAHDFNNILTAVIGNVALMLDATAEAGPQRQTLTAIDKAARRAAELTNRLLGYSRRTTLHLRPSNVNRIVQDTLSLLRPTFDPRIVFDLRFGADAWPVLADADQISQVVTNLCLNSRDAMPRGGKLTVVTSNCGIDEGYVKGQVIAQPGEYVRVTVEDNGAGMSPEVRAHVFEPFFTTKPLGVGTGLGLAMVYGIMKSHGGWVTCQSEPGAGTRMEMYLPRSPQPVEETAQAAGEPPPLRPARGETILLVDDEPAIRTLGRMVLERNGYRVLLAEDGIDAVETFREVADQVALVILDLTMPRLSGQDTYLRLREINPNVRVLFSSGYSADYLGHIDGATGFINKPYRPAELLEAIRAHLPAEGPRG
jgi:two-component system, cell cycle sensor histidine kinase and response regulator CckA